MEEEGIDMVDKYYKYKKTYDNYKPLIPLSISFLMEYPIILVILVILSLIFSVGIVTGIISLFSNQVFIVIFLFSIILLFAFKRTILNNASKYILLFSLIFTLIMIYQQIKSNPLCNIPFIGTLLCGGTEVLLTIPNMLFYFIPAFIVIGFVYYIVRIFNW